MDKQKILYVEDEPFLARIVNESLESRGYDVCLVNDGALVADVFNDYQPDICVLDVMLPHRDGFSLAKDIREINPQIPIIFLTAKVRTNDLIKGFESGGNDYLRKPFSMEELIVRIKNLLAMVSRESDGQSKRAIPQVILLGNYIFYPARFELHLGENVKKLSNRENRLLQLLTKELDSPVLRRDILLEIWGDDSFYNSRNLDVYISHLRDFFSEDSNIRIITIKGVGYQFKC